MSSPEPLVPGKLVEGLPPATADEKLLAELTQAASEVEAGLDAEHKPWPPSDHAANNWASEIHHPCLRALTYMRRNWRDRKPMDLDGLYRVEAGIEEERRMKIALTKAGFEVELQQQRFTWDEFQISGRIDGMIRIGKDRLPLEIKSMNPVFWDRHSTIEDIKASQMWWIQKMTSQLNLYLFMTGKPGGFLGLTTFGKRPRILPMVPDYDLADLDTGKARQVNKHLAAGTLPEPIPYHPQVCGMCDFQSTCSPLKVLDKSWREIPQADIPLLERYLELKDSKAAFEKLHAELVGDNKKPGRYFGLNAMAGEVEITSKPRPMTAYDVPKETKDQFKRTYEITTTSIERAGK